MNLPVAEAFRTAIERWHEFYLLAGTAAVTLVGLLFVALSFHLETLLEDHRAHLLAAARGAFSSYLYVMIFSLMILVPGTSPRMIGVWTIASAVAFATFYVLAFRTSGSKRDASGHDRFLGRRRRVVIALYAFAAVVGGLLLKTGDSSLLLNFMPVIVMQLANAAWTSWDLLVQVGRMKRAGSAASSQ